MGDWREVQLFVEIDPGDIETLRWLSDQKEDPGSVLHECSAYFGYQAHTMEADGFDDDSTWWGCRFNVRSTRDGKAFQFVQDLAKRIADYDGPFPLSKKHYIDRYRLVGWTRLDTTEIPTLLYFFNERVIPVGMASTLLHKAPKELW